MHVVKLQIRILPEDDLGVWLRPAEILQRLVRVDTRARHGHQKGLRQPRDPERSPEMDRRAIRRSDHDRRILPSRIHAGHPVRDLVSAHTWEPSRRDRLEPPTPHVDLL
jgi:hypothetical protein